MGRGAQLFVAAPLRAAARPALDELLASMCAAPGQADPHNPLIPFARMELLRFARLVILDDPSLSDRAAAAPGLPSGEPVRLALILDGEGSAEDLLEGLVDAATTGLVRIFSHCEDFDPDRLRDWLTERRVVSAARYLNAPHRSPRQIREESQLHRTLRTCRQAWPTLDAEALAPRLVAAGAACQLSPIEPPSLLDRLREAAHFLLLPLLIIGLAPVLLLLAPVFAVILRCREKRDPVIAPRPDRARNRMLSGIEDHDLTNQYSAIGSLKPGRFRHWLTIAILWLIDWGSRHLYTRERLARVNTIHAASWTFLDDRRRIFFASNYDGSREAYNDDFINKVAFGLNLSFSNGLGYPRTNWLVLGGAWHEQDFKRYLFHHQIPTQVWYKPDPGLTNYDMARNARIREGFVRPLRGEALRRWIAEI